MKNSLEKSMFLFLETVRIQMYRAQHLSYHRRRIVRALEHLFSSYGCTGLSAGTEADAVLREAVGFIHAEVGRSLATPRRYRLRIVYGAPGGPSAKETFSIAAPSTSLIDQMDISVYEPKRVTALAVRCIDSLEYGHKWLDRTALNATAYALPHSVEPLLTKNGVVLETRYANLAFLRHGVWHTPEHPLHRGTARDRLIERGVLVPRVIRSSDIGLYESVSLFNSMLELGEVVVSADRIYRS